MILGLFSRFSLHMHFCGKSSRTVDPVNGEIEVAGGDNRQLRVRSRENRSRLGMKLRQQRSPFGRRQRQVLLFAGVGTATCDGSAVDMDQASRVQIKPRVVPGLTGVDLKRIVL